MMFIKKHRVVNNVFLVCVCAFIVSCNTTRRTTRIAAGAMLHHAVLAHAHVGITVRDASTGKLIYDQQGDKYFVPASNTKIATCYVALKYLGDSLELFRYLTVMDTLFLIPSGNPSFLHPDFDATPALNLLSKSKVVVIKREPFTQFIGSGWAWNDFQEYYMAQRSPFPLYGNTTLLSLDSSGGVTATPGYFNSSIRGNHDGSKGIAVERPWDANAFSVSKGTSKKVEITFNPDTGTIAALLTDTLKRPVQYRDAIPAGELKSFYLTRTDSLLKVMMHRSDNFFAEQSLLMVSRKKHADYSSINDLLLQSDFEDLPQLPRWADGSGLSRYNLFTPRDFTVILDKMRREFGMDRLKNIMATGNTGTLTNYYKQDSTYIFAKTGTLSGVVAISGFLYTKKDRLLEFSVLVNNHNGSATEVRRLVESFVHKLRENY